MSVVSMSEARTFLCKAADVLASEGKLLEPMRVVKVHDDHVNVLLPLDDRLLSAASSFFGEASGVALWRTNKDGVPRLKMEQHIKDRRPMVDPKATVTAPKVTP